MRQFLVTTSSAALLIAATALPASAAIVQNGSFDNGFSGWILSGNNGTTPGTGPSVITLGGSNSTGYGDNVPTYNGSTHAAFFVDDNANESISQTFDLVGGKSYKLSFGLFATASGARNPNFFTISDSINGSSLNTFTNNDTAEVPVGQWSTQTGTYVAANSGAYTLTYNFASGAYTAKDVALTGVSLSTVPLPASAPLFGAALLALAGFGYGMNRWVAPKGKKAVSAA